MTVYEVLDNFKCTSEESFNVVVKGKEDNLLLPHKMDFYEVRQSVLYYDDAEDKHIANVAEKTVLSIDLQNNIIIVEE